MFNYYGSKKRVAKMYPEPGYRQIVEPFCGSAAYSVLHSDRQVWLNDLNRDVCEIWTWLIRDASVEELWGHHQFHVGDDIRHLAISDSHRLLLSYLVGSLGQQRYYVATQLGLDANRATYKYRVETCIRKICQMLLSIRHWQVSCGDYRDLPNVEATWFIDPPYTQGGHRYKHRIEDYEELAQWCRTRKGEVIVCEKSGANWLPFEPLTRYWGQRSHQVEVMWYQRNSCRA